MSKQLHVPKLKDLICWTKKANLIFYSNENNVFTWAV